MKEKVAPRLNHRRDDHLFVDERSDEVEGVLDAGVDVARGTVRDESFEETGHSVWLRGPMSDQTQTFAFSTKIAFGTRP